MPNSRLRRCRCASNVALTYIQVVHAARIPAVRRESPRNFLENSPVDERDAVDADGQMSRLACCQPISGLPSGKLAVRYV